MSGVNPWIKGAFILSIAGIFTKILSAVYRVPFQNLVGDHGFYIYQQVYPFYGIIIAFMMYGFPMAFSKLYVENNENKDRDFTSIFSSLVMISVVGFLLLNIGADTLARWMKDDQLSPLFKTLSYLWLLFPFISFRRGLFQGKGNMFPTALSQVGEQLVRVVTILAGAYVLTSTDADLYDVGNVAVFGSITGGVMALIILYSYTSWGKLLEWRYFQFNWKIAKNFMVLGFIFSINGLLFVFLQLADSLQLYPIMVTSGQDPQIAKELKGVYDRGQPLIQLGVVLATSFSLALVPGLAKLQAKQEHHEIKKYVKLSIKVSIVIGLAASVGYMMIMEPLNEMLFQTASGKKVLMILTVSVFLGSVIMTSFGIMQGLGYYRPLVFVCMGTFLAKVGFNYILIPFLGTMGSALATVLSLVILLGWMANWLWHQGLLKGVSSYFHLKVLMANLIMAATVWLSLQLLNDLTWLVSHSRIQSTIQTMLSCVVGGFVYLWLIGRFRIFEEEELVHIPFGKHMKKYSFKAR
ncbi:oligosaccharide flippase family protein [Bacillus carboniphilus]|uniref:putative polysaccharide biosynthesis protein n=1 Tax=Bacillus carboniphilus TaxID=86663 RepID=UPI0031D3691D